MWKYALIILAASAMLAADEPKPEAVKQDMKKLTGRWRAADYVSDGKHTVPDDQLALIQLHVYLNGHFKIERAGDTVVDGVIRIDPTKKPKTMNIEYTKGPDQGKTALAIYDIDGDTFRICRATPGNERPTDFESKQGMEHILLVYKREKR
jgi:uncharacterized protein (TIGR03067 family)